MPAQANSSRFWKLAKQEKNKCGSRRIPKKIKKAIKTKTGINCTFIQSILNCSPSFIGCYAENELENLVFGSLPCYIIVNLDNDQMAGSHWIAIGIFEATVEIFDSLGFNVLNWPRIPYALLSFLHRLALFKTVCCSKRLQPEVSTLCGFYCIFYVKFRPFFSFSFLENLFTANLESNDLKLHKIFK